MKTFTPYTDNIIFLDTEFSSLDPEKGEIISIGLVKMSGDSLYLELEHEGEVSDWVKENLISSLNQKKVSRAEARKQIKKFVGESKPYFISYVTHYDSVYLKKLFKVGDLAHNNEHYPFHWMPIDFSSILFAQGIRPEDFTHNKKDFYKHFKEIDLSQYQEHHALDDARLLREIYIRMAKQPKKK